MRRFKIWPLIVAILFAAVVFFGPQVFADEACKAAGYDDPLICGQPENDDELEIIATVRNILTVVYLWIGIIAVIFIVVGGISYMTSQGEAEKIKRAKSTIVYSICGLIVTLAAFAITNFTIAALQGNVEGQATGATGDDDPYGENRTKVRGIAAPSKITLIVGQAVRINARIIPDYAINKKLTYRSDDEVVAKVDRTGYVSTYRPGTATITIKSSDGPTKEVEIIVKKTIPVTKIRLEATEVKLKKNKTTTVKATPLPGNATDKTLIWASKDPNIATVTQTGTIKAIKSDAETYVTVTARNLQIVALGSKSPNQITLADAEPLEELPKVEEKIKVIVESEFYACQGDTSNKKFSGNLEMRQVNKQFVDKAKKDFYHYNEGSVISKNGGYTSYVKKLGGIFTMYAGKDKKMKVKSACDFQAAAEYAYGLWSVWGVDYDNGSSYHDWGGSTSDQSDAFYRGAGGRHAGAGFSYRDIDTNLGDDYFKHRRRTNCNYACDAMVQKTTLRFDSNFCSSPGHTANLSKVGKIHNTAQLKVGDMVHYYRDGRWRHVAVVGEVYSDYIIMYDGGGRFIETKQYKKKVRRGGSMINGTTYDSYDYWFGVRTWDIDQSRTLEGLK